MLDLLPRCSFQFSVVNLSPPSHCYSRKKHNNSLIYHFLRHLGYEVMSNCEAQVLHSACHIRTRHVSDTSTAPVQVGYVQGTYFSFFCISSDFLAQVLRDTARVRQVFKRERVGLRMRPGKKKKQKKWKEGLWLLLTSREEFMSLNDAMSLTL